MSMPALSRKRLLDLLWLVLLALTLGGGLIGEAVDPGLAAALAVCLGMAVKGRVVVDHFMELSTANRTLRRLMRAYFYVLPLVTLFVYVRGDWLARLTTLP